MADYSGVHMSHSPYLRPYGECHPGGYCAADDWGQGIHEGTYDVVNAWLDAYTKKQREHFGQPKVTVSQGVATITREPIKKEKPVAILDAQTLKLISRVMETLNSLNDEEWPDVYITVDLKSKHGDKIGAFTDEYGAWVFETASDAD